MTFTVAIRYTEDPGRHVDREADAVDIVAGGGLVLITGPTTEYIPGHRIHRAEWTVTG